MLARLQQAVIRNENVFAVLMDAVRVCSITTNLGDVKTTISHPASTSHGTRDSSVAFG